MSGALRFLQDLIEVHDLVRDFGCHKLGKRKWGDPHTRDEVLEFLPSAAINQYLFSAEQSGRLVAMAIAGPTHKPSGLHGYGQDGLYLFCYYALVHPQWRVMGRGWQLLKSMTAQAVTRFPTCEVLSFYRHDGKRYVEKPISAGGVEWGSSTRERSPYVMDGNAP